MTSLYDIPLSTITGQDTSLRAHAGQVLLIVNVASQCGLTPQYAALQALQERYRRQGLAVLGFPANDFGAQEPGTHEEIREFCESRFGVDFPLFAKVTVKGPDTHPLFRRLIESRPQATPAPGGKFRRTLASHGIRPDPETGILWNFEKFLVSRAGEVVARFEPDVAPDDPLVVAAVERELAAP